MRSKIRNRKSAIAFTLIELLVVVTIIVVLLALLVPAMDRAIYQAELLRCAGTLRATASGVLQYAFDHKRRYPDRGLEDRGRDDTVIFLPAMGLAYPLDRFDARPPLRGIFSIDEMLQCPFNEPVEMDETDPDVAVEASYMLLWGWQYKPQSGPLRGMFKIGDRFEWRQAGRTASYNVLVCDMDLRYPAGLAASHPDRAPVTMTQQILREEPSFSGRTNFSRWYNLNSQGLRGTMDLNYAYDDGSVRRLTELIGWDRQDERIDRIPLQYDIRRNGDRFHVPSR